MSTFNTLDFKFCPRCGERLSYTLYEGYCAYVGCLWNNEESEECTPSASTPSVPADVVAHGTGSGGECAPREDYTEFLRLVALADATVEVPLIRASRGGHFLMALANVCAPPTAGLSSEFGMRALHHFADQCIQAGC